jgi:hypothetical protein
MLDTHATNFFRWRAPQVSAKSLLQRSAADWHFFENVGYLQSLVVVMTNKAN